MITVTFKETLEPMPEWVKRPFPPPAAGPADPGGVIIRTHVRADRFLVLLGALGFGGIREAMIRRAMANQVWLAETTLEVQAGGVWDTFPLEGTVGAGVLAGDRLVVYQRDRTLTSRALCRPQAISHAINRLLSGMGRAAPEQTCSSCRYFRRVDFVPASSTRGVGTYSNRGRCRRPGQAGIPLRCCFLEGNTDWCHAYHARRGG